MSSAPTGIAGSPPSLLVRSVADRTVPAANQRWLDAVLKAVAAAVVAGSVGNWRLVVDGVDDADGWEARVREAGGAYGARAEGDPEDVVLTIAQGAVLLGSTIVRLLDTLKGGVAGVQARELPLPGAAPPAVTATRGQPGNGPLTEAPHAVVFADRRLPEAGTPLPVRGTSLLELSLEPPLLESARRAVATALGSPQPLLSVVLRTQATRPETLRDALLALPPKTTRDSSSSSSFTMATQTSRHASSLISLRRSCRGRGSSRRLAGPVPAP